MIQGRICIRFPNNSALVFADLTAAYSATPWLTTRGGATLVATGAIIVSAATTFPITAAPAVAFPAATFLAPGSGDHLLPATFLAPGCRPALVTGQSGERRKRDLPL